MSKSPIEVISLCVILYISASSCSEKKEIGLLSNRTQEVRKGDVVVMSCLISPTLDLFVENLLWYKVSHFNESNVKEIANHWKGTGEYEKKVKLDLKALPSKKVKTELTIKAIEESDDGWYMCALVNKNETRIVEATTDIIVLRDVLYVELEIGTERIRSDSVSESEKVMKVFKPLPLTCSTSDVNPVATLRVTIGGRDVTKSLRYKRNVDIKGTAFKGIRLWSVSLRGSRVIKEEDVGKKIRCEAITNSSTVTNTSSNSHKHVAIYRIIQNARPMFKCEDQVVRYGSKAIINCLIYHKIGAVNKVEWVDQHLQRVIPLGSSVPGFSSTLEKMDNNTVRAILSISKVNREENIYQLEIDHMDWKIDHKVRVSARLSVTDDPTGAAISLVVSNHLVAVIGVAVLVSSFIDRLVAL